MEATRSRRGSDSEWGLAVQLAGHISAGGDLPVLASPVLLDPGEALHADLSADGWRFLAIDVFYDEPRVVAFGGPLLFATTALAAGSARRRARAEAERLAAPADAPRARRARGVDRISGNLKVDKTAHSPAISCQGSPLGGSWR